MLDSLGGGHTQELMHRDAVEPEPESKGAASSGDALAGLAWMTSSSADISSVSVFFALPCPSFLDGCPPYVAHFCFRRPRRPGLICLWTWTLTLMVTNPKLGIDDVQVTSA